MYILVYAYEKESSPNVVLKEDDLGNIWRERLDTPRKLTEGEDPIGYAVCGHGDTRREAYNYAVKSDALYNIQWLTDAPDFECDMLDTYDLLSVLKEKTGFYFIKIDNDFAEWLRNTSYYEEDAIYLSDLNYKYDVFLEHLIDYDEDDGNE